MLPDWNCMSQRQPKYGLTDLVDGLRLTGLCPGDVVFFQISHLKLGVPKCGSSINDVCELLFSAIRDVIGPDGTMLLPAFSFSFSNNEDFDPQATPIVQGDWSAS